MQIRNFFYDVGMLMSWRYNIPIICVGNITVGGTGKTPLIEYIINLLKEYNVALVSRGYRRKTSGLVIADDNSTAADIGDEPKQIHSKFPRIPIAVDANRTNAIEWLIENKHPDVILMDDGMQHRSVEAGFNIVVVDYYRSMWNDYTFPAGNLREPWSARYRADVIVVNKCPEELSENEKMIIVAKLRPSIYQSVVFTTIKYGVVHRLLDDQPVLLKRKQKVVCVAGIGKPELFFEHCKKNYKCMDCLTFEDHRQFSRWDVQEISKAVKNAGENTIVLTTEKDSTRFPKIEGVEVYYLPITLEVLFDEKSELNSRIIHYVTKKQ